MIKTTITDIILLIEGINANLCHDIMTFSSVNLWHRTSDVTVSVINRYKSGYKEILKVTKHLIFSGLGMFVSLYPFVGGPAAGAAEWD